MKLFRQGKVDEGLELIVDMMIENNKDEVVFKKLTELYDYFVHNKEGLVPYKLRDNITMPTAPEGLIDTVILEIPLSASAVNKKGTKSKEYKIHTAPIPYSGDPVSLGRKVIQKLCGLKGFGSFSYN